MLKIIATLGPTGVGKTAILKAVQEYFREKACMSGPGYNMSKYLRVKTVVTTTDRNQRQGEINGVHYHFLSPKLFEQKVNTDQFVETKCTQDNEGNDLHYGLTISALGPLENDDILLLSIDYGGLLNLRNYLDEKELDADKILFPIFITASAESRMKRCLGREAGDRRLEPCSDNLVYKTCERMLQDAKEIEDAKDFCILTLNNEQPSDKVDCTNFIIKLIQGML